MGCCFQDLFKYCLQYSCVVAVKCCIAITIMISITMVLQIHIQIQVNTILVKTGGLYCLGTNGLLTSEFGSSTQGERHNSYYADYTI